MSSRRERRRAKRQSDQLRAEAWEAAKRGRLDLARRRLDRAVAEGPGNARLWLDTGRLARLAGRPHEAEEALRRALALSPGYAEAKELLLELVLARGAGEEAVALQESWLARHPGAAEERRLAELRGRFGIAPPEELRAELDALGSAPLLARTADLDRESLEEELTRHGCAVVPRFLGEDERAELFALAGGAAPLGPAVRLRAAPLPPREARRSARERARGGAVRRALEAPLPELVRELRGELYARLLPLARRWDGRLALGLAPPAHVEGFLELCRRAGAERAAVASLALEAGARVELPAVEGALLFPLRALLVLGCGGGEGRLELELSDLRVGKGGRCARRSARPGGLLLAAARERPLAIGGVWGRQPVVTRLACPGEVGLTLLELGFEGPP